MLHLQSSPYLDKRKPPDDGSVLAGNERYEGYCVDLSQKLFEMLEMNYELRLVGDGKYGSRLLNGTWDGMVGELTSHVRTRTTELYIYARVSFLVVSVSCRRRRSPPTTPVLTTLLG